MSARPKPTSGRAGRDEEADITLGGLSDVSSGPELVKQNARSVRWDILLGVEIAVVILTWSTILVDTGMRTLGAVTSLVGTYAAGLLLLAYGYRIYTNKPDAGQTIYMVGLLGLLCSLVVLGIWHFIRVLAD